MKMIFVLLLLAATIAATAQPVSTDTMNRDSVYGRFYLSLSQRIKSALKESGFFAKQNALLFSIRIQVDSTGNVAALATSMYTPAAVKKALGKALDHAPAGGLPKDMFVTVPVIVIPTMDIAHLFKEGKLMKQAACYERVSAEMLKELYNYDGGGQKKYSFWQPVMPGIVFAPVLYPYEVKEGNGKFGKYYKR